MRNVVLMSYIAFSCFVLNPNHASVPATTKTINSIPAKPRTVLQVENVLSLFGICILHIPL